MTGQENIERLLFNLDREEECLTEMVRILEAEADALRHLRREELVRYAGEKLALVETHQALVCERTACIDAVAPSAARPHTLTELRSILAGRPEEGAGREEARPGGDDEIAPRQRRLRDLCDRVGRLRAHNMALADMGRLRVDETLRTLRARRNPVYGGDARLHAQRPNQRRRGRF